MFPRHAFSSRSRFLPRFLLACARAFCSAAWQGFEIPVSAAPLASGLDSGGAGLWVPVVLFRFMESLLSASLWAVPSRGVWLRLGFTALSLSPPIPPTPSWAWPKLASGATEC